jgi:homospermidine synthase
LRHLHVLPREAAEATDKATEDLHPHSDAIEEAASALPPLPGRILLLGFGCIGSAVLPLLTKRFGIPPDRIAILTACDRGAAQAHGAGVSHETIPVTPENAAELLKSRLQPGDVLLNLAVEVSSAEVADICLASGVHYLDTAPEPWAGGYSVPRSPFVERCTYGLLQQTRAVATRHGRSAPTSLIGSGANPGLVSLFIKRALINLAASHGIAPRAEGFGLPETQPEWASLAQRIGVKAIHINESDTQYSITPPSPGRATNTWSVAGLLAEAYLPSELSFGTHEAEVPADGHFHAGPISGSIYLSRPGVANHLRSWLPGIGQYRGFLISHPEAFTIADFLTVRDEAGRILHRPTVLFAYRPCDAARRLLNGALGADFRIGAEEKSPMIEDVGGGAETLGVLLMGQTGRSYWYGSRLNALEARQIAPYNNATTLQVCAGVVAGLSWMLENPRRGLCEPEEIDLRRGLAVARPYLGQLFGTWTCWHPPGVRCPAMPSETSRPNPWQFADFRVT